MSEKVETFVWYATDPKDGELVFYGKQGSKTALVYSTRMIRDRFGPKLNAVICLELSLGPLGFIPYDLYKECGVFVKVPADIRFITILESNRFDEEGEAKEMLPENNKRLSDFMLVAWSQRSNPPV